MPARPGLGPTELEVLRYVTAHAPITVREVAVYFAEHSGLKRTTVLTIMERLRRKELLSRKRKTGVFEYSPVASSDELERSLVRRFVHDALGGKVAPLIAFLSEETDLTSDELQRLERLAQQLDDSRDKGEG